MKWSFAVDSVEQYFSRTAEGYNNHIMPMLPRLVNKKNANMIFDQVVFHYILVVFSGVFSCQIKFYIFSNLIKPYVRRFTFGMIQSSQGSYNTKSVVKVFDLSYCLMKLITNFHYSSETKQCCWIENAEKIFSESITKKCISCSFFVKQFSIIIFFTVKVGRKIRIELENEI